MPDNGPLIQPVTVPNADATMQIIADADPEMFPDGIDLIIGAPGRIQPLGHLVLPKGCLVAVMPPGLMADHMRAQMKAAIAAQKALQRAAERRVDIPGARG